jgi:hypothetical protein
LVLLFKNEYLKVPIKRRIDFRGRTQVALINAIPAP